MKRNFKTMALMIVVFAFGLVGFSTAVYGRFTKQYNPEVSSFGITISSQENIMVSATGEAGTFKDVLKLQELVSNTDVSLTPLKGKVTPTEDELYEVFSLTHSQGAPIEGKYYTFPLYFVGSSDMNLYFKGSTTGVGAIFDDSDADHHFTNEERERLLANLRIGFLTYSTTYQPSGTGTTIAYSDEPVRTNIYATSVIDNGNYTTFSKLGYSNTAGDTVLAYTKKNQVTKVDVVIWLEEDALGDLEAICKLTLSIRFEAILAKNG